MHSQNKKCNDDSGARAKRKPPLRSAFSLLELLLVLAILVTLAAVVAPSLTGMLAERKLQRGADEIRIAWQRARLEAMKTGQAQVFRCMLGSREYSLQPWLGMDDMANAGPGATLMVGGGMAETSNVGGATVLQAVDAASQKAKTLEEGLSFATGNAEMDSRSMQTLGAMAAAGMGGTGGTSWSSPILFYPDGSTSTAEIFVTDERGQLRSVRIRGLTGAADVAEVAKAANGQVLSTN